MGGRILVAQACHQSRRRKSKASDDCCSPFDGDEIDRLSVGHGSLDASDGSSISAIDKDFDLGVDVGKSVGDAWDLILCTRVDLDVERVVEVAGAHGTETQEAIASGARVDRFADYLVAVRGNGEVEDHVPLHGGGRCHIHSDGVVVGRIDDIEQAGRET